MKRSAILFVAAVTISAVGSAGYLAASGARAGGPLLFVVLSAFAVCLSVWALVKSAMALTTEPDALEEMVATGRRRKELLREKQSLLKALKELEFDHEMGKISDADYAEIAQQYRARAVRILKRLDEGGEYRDRIEAEIVQLRQNGIEKPNKPDPGSSVIAAPGASPEPVKGEDRDPLNDLAKAAVEATTQSDRRRCEACGADNEGDAVFCKRCAARVAGAAS